MLFLKVKRFGSMKSNMKIPYLDDFFFLLSSYPLHFKFVSLGVIDLNSLAWIFFHTFLSMLKYTHNFFA